MDAKKRGTAEEKGKEGDSALRWSLASDPDVRTVSVGQIVEFKFIATEPGTEFRLLLKQDEVQYLAPIRDWSSHPGTQWLASGPGLCEFRLERRLGEVALESTSGEILVTGASEFEPFPRCVDLDPATKLWVPSEWEVGNLNPWYEKSSIDLLRSIVRPGTVAYDLGANLGIFALRIARLLGEAGRLYCFEANPLCVYFLRANLRGNGLANSTILPVAVGMKSSQCPFAIDYFNTATGTSGESPHFSYKNGQTVEVASFRIDDLVERGLVAPPAFVKIDIEGSEVAALSGMHDVLERHRPDLLIEVHGREAGLGVIDLLGRLDYRFWLIPKDGHANGVEAFVARLPQGVFQMLASPFA